EIARIALREGTDCSTVGSRVIAASEELPICRRRLDHPRALRVEDVSQDEQLVVVGQLGRGLETQVQAAILRPILRETFELHDERGHEVEGQADGRELAQE